MVNWTHTFTIANPEWQLPIFDLPQNFYVRLDRLPVPNFMGNLALSAVIRRFPDVPVDPINLLLGEPPYDTFASQCTLVGRCDFEGGHSNVSLTISGTVSYQLGPFPALSK